MTKGRKKDPITYVPIFTLASCQILKRVVWLNAHYRTDTTLISSILFSILWGCTPATALSLNNELIILMMPFPSFNSSNTTDHTVSKWYDGPKAGRLGWLLTSNCPYVCESVFVHRCLSPHTSFRLPGNQSRYSFQPLKPSDSVVLKTRTCPKPGCTETKTRPRLLKIKPSQNQDHKNVF